MKTAHHNVPEAEVTVKTPKYSNYSLMQPEEAANCNIWEPGSIKYLVFLLEKNRWLIDHQN